MMNRAKLLVVGILGSLLASELAGADESQSAASVLWQPSMNVFRRYAVEPEAQFAFYRDVLGFEQLNSFDLGGDVPLIRIRAGASELKFTRRVGDRSYVGGGVHAATGLRLWTFFFSDEDAVVARFENHGLPVPKFEALDSSGRRSALVYDPDGQAVELVITGDPPGTEYDEIEVGLTVSDLQRSRAFYRDFVGLEELAPQQDARFNTMKYSFRHGSTIVSLRHFGDELPADTGTGGIQYVVSDVERIDELAHSHAVRIDQPLSELQGFALRTIWLDDPDGITNYFAQTAQSGGAATQ